MRMAREILLKVEELLESGIPVYITDGTVTRIVTGVEHEFNAQCEYLAVCYEADGKRHFLEVETDLSGRLPSWALRKYGGGWFFAPLWWHLL